MREFTAHMNEHLINGLYREERTRLNDPLLSEAYNVRAMEHGLEAHRRVVDPFDGNIVVSFPFPQLYVGEHQTLLLGEQFISSVNRASSPWSSSPYSMTPVESGGVTTIPAGGVWHVVDLKDVWYLFNGECTVAKLPDSDNPYLDTQIKITTGTHFRGRVVVGGLRPAEIWSRGWDRIFSFWKENNVIPPGVEHDDVNRNYVMWGSIGGGDFPLWLIKPDIITEGHIQSKAHHDYMYPADETYAMEQLRLGQFGFMPMPFQGEVLCVKPLGNGVMVYGEDGIVYLPHVSAAEPAPTFGMRPVMMTGVMSRGAVGGSDLFHVFVDSGGSLWSIDAELNPQRLGYKHFFEGMAGDDILITHDEERTAFYISNGENTYLLSSGLTEVSQHLTSLRFVDGSLTGLFEQDEDDEARVVTMPLDMNLRAIKTATGLNVGVRCSAPVYGAIDFRYQRGEAFQRTPFVVLNREGNATIRAAGIEFRAVIKCDDYEDFELDYIKLRWQSSDRRAVRGVDDASFLTEA